jgi:hypothetical protein
VPKKELVSTLQVLLAARRLKVAPTLAAAPTLVRLLANCQVEVTRTAHETFGSWRDGQHADLVPALALAVWYAEPGASLVGHRLTLLRIARCRMVSPSLGGARLMG